MRWQVEAKGKDNLRTHTRVTFLHIAKSCVTELPVSRFTGQIFSIPMKDKRQTPLSKKPQTPSPCPPKPNQPSEVFLASALHAPNEGQGFWLARQLSGDKTSRT